MEPAKEQTLYLSAVAGHFASDQGKTCDALRAAAIPTVSAQQPLNLHEIFAVGALTTPSVDQRLHDRCAVLGLVFASPCTLFPRRPGRLPALRSADLPT